MVCAGDGPSDRCRASSGCGFRGRVADVPRHLGGVVGCGLCCIAFALLLPRRLSFGSGNILLHGPCARARLLHLFLGLSRRSQIYLYYLVPVLLTDTKRGAVLLPSRFLSVIGCLCCRSFDGWRAFASAAVCGAGAFALHRFCCGWLCLLRLFCAVIHSRHLL